MRRTLFPALIGFAILFALYQAAVYMIVFQNSAVGFLFFHALFFLAAYGIARWQGQPGLRAWGLDCRKGFGKHLAIGMLMGIVLYSASFLASVLAGVERILFVPAFRDIAAPLGLFIFGNLFSSFAEDVLTRGYVHHHLKEKVTPILLAIISAVIYVGNHIYRLQEGPVTYLYLFALGLLFIMPLLMTQRLWFTGSMHWAGNVTFYFTHESLRVDELPHTVTSNFILVAVILIMFPLCYAVIVAARLKSMPSPIVQ